MYIYYFPNRRIIYSYVSREQITEKFSFCGFYLHIVEIQGDLSWMYQDKSLLISKI